MKRALVTALLVCGCQASTPSRDPKPKEANIAMSKPVAGSKTVAAVTCHGRSPAKPPNQTYPCDIEVSGAPASARWLLVPRSLDEPLRESSPIDKLELAVASSSGDAEVAAAAKRNLALALYRRGWKQLQAGKAAEASADFERALRIRAC